MARVLVFFLAFVPVCQAEYYDSDEDIDRGESYDKYNEEIKAPLKFTTVVEGLTRLKRWNLDDLVKLSAEEPIVDVKGVLNNILQGDQSDALGGPRNLQQHTQSYVYVEDAVPDRAKHLPNQKREFKQWMPTVVVSKRSPRDDKQENTIESSRETMTEQHWTFVYQPETSTSVKNDIIAEVRKLQPIKQREVPRPFQTETWFTTDGTESTIDSNNYPQETTTYNPSEMQAEVKKLVQHWTPATNARNYPQEFKKYNPSEMHAEVNKLLQHWSPATNANHYPQEVKKYNPSEMHAEVNKLLQHWSPATNANKKSSSYNSAGMRADVRNLVQHWSPSRSIQDMSTSSRLPHRSHASSVQLKSHPSRVQHEHPAVSKSPIPKMNQQTSRMQIVVKELNPNISGFKQQEEHRNPVNFLRFNASDNVQQHAQRPRPFAPLQKLSSSVDGPQRSSSLNILLVSRTMDARSWNSIAADNQDLAFNSSDDFEADTSEKNIMRQKQETTTETNTITTIPPETITTTTIKTTTSKKQIDIDDIMAIIANLTDDYEWNLTEQFNKTLIEQGVPTCPWKGFGKWGPGGAWTATTPTTPIYDFENAALVQKCFVCGLTDVEIPRNAYCGDAFAGDFLPLMPVDPKSRGKVAGYRKYCRYLDVPNYVESPVDTRAIYGRFTGGCAVRWTDLTGIYTQRTCRSLERPLLGKHFASKRMTKLEFALANVKDGCIYSPMATLLPVSRGISLYSRFHACVCTGNWCNSAIQIKASTNTVIALVLHWLLHIWPS